MSNEFDSLLDRTILLASGLMSARINIRTVATELECWMISHGEDSTAQEIERIERTRRLLLDVRIWLQDVDDVLCQGTHAVEEKRK